MVVLGFGCALQHQLCGRYVNEEVMSYPPVIKTKNYKIRSFEQRDLVAFTAYRSDENVARYQSWTDFSYEDAVSLFDSTDYSQFGTAGQWFQLAIVSPDNEELVGDLALHFIDEEQVEIGFTVSPKWQRRSVASEAVSALLSYLFNDLGKHRVIATTDTKNVASYKLLEKTGFRREAHFVENIFFKGAWGDEYQYGLLKSEAKFT